MTNLSDFVDILACIDRTKPMLQRFPASPFLDRLLKHIIGNYRNHREDQPGVIGN